MRKLRFLMPVVFLLIVAGVSAIVMLLWNWLMPAIFGLITISFWQAFGLLALARILFGGFGSGKYNVKRVMHGMGENPIHKKWKEMTPEQREEFVKRRRRFGFGGPFERDCFDNERQEELKDGRK